MKQVNWGESLQRRDENQQKNWPPSYPLALAQDFRHIPAWSMVVQTGACGGVWSADPDVAFPVEPCMISLREAGRG